MFHANFDKFLIFFCKSLLSWEEGIIVYFVISGPAVSGTRKLSLAQVLHISVLREII